MPFSPSPERFASPPVGLRTVPTTNRASGKKSVPAMRGGRSPPRNEDPAADGVVAVRGAVFAQPAASSDSGGPHAFWTASASAFFVRGFGSTLTAPER